MLYLAYRENEDLLKGNCKTWFEAYLSHRVAVDTIEKRFYPAAKILWGDIDIASETIAYRDENIFTFNSTSHHETDFLVTEKYDIQHDLVHKMC